MDNKLRLIAACPPENVSMAASKGLQIAHMCYRVCRDGRLYIAENANPKGGIMALDFQDQCHSSRLSPLSDAIIRECKKRSFSGIFIDIPKSCMQSHSDAAVYLAQKANSAGLRTYVPQHIGSRCQNAKLIISTAVSGGTYEGFISSAVKKYGAQNIALEADLITSDFTLPDRSGSGKHLSKNEFKKLYTAYGKNSFFSKELCAYYFTYTANGKTHFVLYETSKSIRAKLSIGSKMGIYTVFMYYPDFAGIIF